MNEKPKKENDLKNLNQIRKLKILGIESFKHFSF